MRTLQVEQLRKRKAELRERRFVKNRRSVDETCFMCGLKPLYTPQVEQLRKLNTELRERGVRIHSIIQRPTTSVLYTYTMCSPFDIHLLNLFPCRRWTSCKQNAELRERVMRACSKRSWTFFLRSVISASKLLCLPPQVDQLRKQNAELRERVIRACPALDPAALQQLSAGDKPLRRTRTDPT